MSETPRALGANGQRPEPSPSPAPFVSGCPHPPAAGAALPVRTYEAIPSPSGSPSPAPVDFRAGTAALAAMPDEEFELRLIAMRRGRERITRIHRELMDPDSDYGVIPGTRQPTLLKPGAEKLCDFYRLAAEFHPQIRYGDGHATPPITVVTECRLHLGTLDGPVVNTGHGAANSWEKRYRYRRGERSCPACGKTGTIIKGKVEFGGGWICYVKKGGCGAKFADEAPEIVEQPVGDVENPDPYDLLNTLLKMSEKRCLGSTTAVLVRTSAGVLRCNVAQMYSLLHRCNEPIYLPAVDGKAWRRVEAMIREADREVFRIDIADGSYLRATAEHRFPTRRGLVSVTELRAGDVLLRSTIDIGERQKADAEFGWIAGLFIAEGCYANNGRAIRFTLHEAETELRERIRKTADRLGATLDVLQRKGRCVAVTVHGPAFCGIIRQFVNGKGSGGKHLSRYSWRQGEQFLTALLDGYLAGDGSYTVRKGSHPFWALGFTGRNRELADDLRSIATILGFRLKIVRRHNTANGRKYPSFIGWLKPNLTTYNQIELGEIIGIRKEAKPAVVYDVQVDGDHLFCLANGIQTHNSYVDATLRATATSGLYTQDLDEAATEPNRPSSAAAETSGERSPDEAPVGTAARERPNTLKEAYLFFREALAEAGFANSDGAAGREVMQAYTSRKSTQAEPYTIEEFLGAADQLRREHAAGGAISLTAGVTARARFGG